MILTHLRVIRLCAYALGCRLIRSTAAECDNLLLNFYPSRDANNVMKNTTLKMSIYQNIRVFLFIVSMNSFYAGTLITYCANG